MKHPRQSFFLLTPSAWKIELTLAPAWCWWIFHRHERVSCRFWSRRRHRHSFHVKFSVAIFIAIHGKRRKTKVGARRSFYGARAYMRSGLLFLTTTHIFQSSCAHHRLMLVLMTSPRACSIHRILLRWSILTPSSTECRPTDLHSAKNCLRKEKASCFVFFFGRFNATPLISSHPTPVHESRSISSQVFLISFANNIFLIFLQLLWTTADDGKVLSSALASFNSN